MYLCAGEGEVPIPSKCFRWREGDPTVVDGCYSQTDVAAENYGGEPDCANLY